MRRTYLNDAGVLAYRHYELVTHAQPDFRISLAPRASIDNGTLIIRKALGGRAHRLRYSRRRRLRQHPRPRPGPGRAARSCWRLSWSTRLTASYDLWHETATGLPGTLQIGWLTFHADI